MRESFGTTEFKVFGDAPHLQPTCKPAHAASSSQSTQSERSSGQRQHIVTWLATQVPESRLQHILRVEQTAIELARHHQLDVAKAAQAGLMHDLAKFFKPARLLEMARREGLALDPVDEADPHLLHAEVGAIVAREEFQVHDEEILNAIRNHTLGRPDMDLLSCVVFLADSLEPGRGDTPELEDLRQISLHSLPRAVWLTCDYSMKYLLSTRRLIHPRTIATRNWFMQAASR